MVIKVHDGVTLLPTESMIAKYIGTFRSRSNRKAGVKDRKRGQHDGKDFDIQAFGAELAFCKLVNVYPDFSISPRKGGYDLILPNGVTVDVKWVGSSDKRLVATLNKKHECADVYVLMCGRMPEYAFRGWCYAAELFDSSNISDVGYGQSYFLPKEKMREILDSLLIAK